jgi:hypothetical protein
MLALNHAATATVIALVIPDPVIAIPLAFVSHFLLDALPHYSAREHFGLGTKTYYVPILLDIIFTISYTFCAMDFFPHHAGLILACIVASTAPDYIWPLNLTSFGKKYLSAFFAFHLGIQRFESTRGIYVEAVWFSATITLLSRLRG